MSRADQRSYTEAQRLEALTLARDHRDAEASTRTGIPRGTLRRWRMEAGQQGPPRGQDPGDWAQAKERAAQATFRDAISILKRVKPLIDAGQHQQASRTAVAGAILLDKSGVLEAGAVAARTRVLDGELTGETRHVEVPDDAERLLEIAAIMAEIGVLGDNNHDDGGRRGDDSDDGWNGPPLLPSPRSHPDGDGREVFEPMAAPRRVVRTAGGARGGALWRPNRAGGVG